MARIKRSLLVVVVLAAGMVLLPAPTVVWASEMATTTVEVDLDPVREAAIDLGIVVLDPDGAEETPAAGDHAAVLGSGIETTAPFTVIGVTVARVPSAPIAVRVRAGGAWQEWVELPVAPDHGADGAEGDGERRGLTSEPYFVGMADAYELQVPADAGAVEVHTVAEVSTLVATIVDDVADGAPAIGTRSAWGARAPRSTVGVADDLEFAVVHHSATSNAYSQGQVPALLRSIQAYHMDANGWNDIGYNFVVDRFGGVWEGRSGGIHRAGIGAHASGFNTGSTGVMVLGNFNEGGPTQASLDAAERIIAWKLTYHQVPTGGNFIFRTRSSTKFGPAGTSVSLPRVLGHRDVGQTSCPGHSLYSRLGEMRRDINGAVGGYQSEARAIALAGDRTGDGKEDLLLYRAGSPQEVDLRGSGGPGGLLGLSTSGPKLTASTASVSGGYRPLIGDFDGNGRRDVMWYAAGGTVDYTWFSSGNGAVRSVATTISGTYEPLVGDFDGNGRDDILWYAPYGDADSIWFGQSNQSFRSAPIRVSGAYEPLVGDFDGDGRDDIMWYGSGARADFVWFGSADGRFVSQARTVSGNYDPFTVDLDGDARTDIVWFSKGATPDHVWSGQANRGIKSASFTVQGDYEPIVGDFAGDGYEDILWNAPDGTDDILTSPSPTGTETTILRMDIGHDVSVLDVDGNGTDELFAQHGSVSGTLYEANGSSFRAIQQV